MHLSSRECVLHRGLLVVDLLYFSFPTKKNKSKPSDFKELCLNVKMHKTKSSKAATAREL